MNSHTRTLPDRRTSDTSVIIDRRQSPRRVSPAVGEYAMQENTKLREINGELLAALQAILNAPSELEYHVNQSASCELCQAVGQARAAITKATQP